MSDFDDQLRRSLSADDEAFLQGLDNERGMFQLLGDSFHGPMKYWNIIVFIATLIATGIGLWAIWHMVTAETLRGLILWAAAGWAAWTMQIALKQWAWDRMRMLNILRELKKIELRLARLEERR